MEESVQREESQYNEKNQLQKLYIIGESDDESETEDDDISIDRSIQWTDEEALKMKIKQEQKQPIQPTSSSCCSAIGNIINTSCNNIRNARLLRPQHQSVLLSTHKSRHADNRWFHAPENIDHTLINYLIVY